MGRVQRNPRRSGLRRGIGWGAALMALLLARGCDCDGHHESAEAAIGEALEVEINGIRGVVERTVARGEAGYVVFGEAGADLHARVLLADAEGAVLADEQLSRIIEPVASAACLAGSTAHVAFVTESDGTHHLFLVGVEPGAPVSGAGEPVMSAEGRVDVAAVEGQDVPCGLCVYVDELTEISCQLDMSAPDRHTWSTGSLGHWTVMQTGSQHILADWSANSAGWVLVRLGRLDLAAAEVDWQHGYEVGQLPQLAEAENRGQAWPRFVPAEGQIHVFFVDGTEYFTRIFAQIFPIEGGSSPQTAEQLEACRGTCDLNWTGLIDGVTWVWYTDEATDYMERLNPDGSHSRVAFEAPDDVEQLGGGLFKLGLGNTIGNVWAVFERGREQH